MENEKIVKSNVLNLWAKNFPEVERWLGHLQKKEENAYYLLRFCEWSQKTPPELLATKAKDASINPPPNEVEKLLDDFCAQTLVDFTNAEKYCTSIAVKSFFRWNYRDLAKASGVVDLVKVKPYNALTKEGLRKLWNRAFNLRDKALITFVNSTAIAKETLTQLTWGHLEENWENKDFPCVNIESEILKGHGRGKYKGVRQITFLTPEAKRDLINYKEWMESPQKLGRKLTLQDHIWLETCKPYRPISYDTFGKLITTISDNAGVSFSWHDARRWVNTALEGISISVNWARKIRGRKVKGEEAPYSQPAIEQLRAKYREAVAILEFTTEGPAVSKEVEELRAKFEEFKKTLTPEELETGRRAGVQFRKNVGKAEPDDEKPDDCPDGHCDAEFLQIPEAQLLAHLKDGWEIVKELSDGDVIVKRVR